MPTVIYDSWLVSKDMKVSVFRNIFVSFKDINR